MKKQNVLSLFLIISLIAGLVQVCTISASAYDNTYEINSGSVTVSASGNYYISGTDSSTANGITVAENISGSVYIALDVVAISSSSDCAFSIGSGSTVYLTLLETNSLTSGPDFSGLNLPSGAALIITSGSTGSLTAQGGPIGADIGGGQGGAG